MKVNIYGTVALCCVLSFSLARQPDNNPVKEVPIYKELSKEIILTDCSFPPRDIQNVDFLIPCNQLHVPKADNESFADNSLGFLCMGFYDISLRLCDQEKHSSRLLYNSRNFSDLNTTIYSLLSQENIMLNGKVNQTGFCEKIARIIMNTTYTQARDHVIILNNALRNQESCKRLCFPLNDRLNHFCSIMFWANKLLFTSQLNASKSENKGQMDREKSGIDIQKSNSGGESNDSVKVHVKDKSVLDYAPPKLLSGTITEPKAEPTHGLENNGTIGSENEPDNERVSKGESQQNHIDIKEYSDPMNANTQEKTTQATSDGNLLKQSDTPDLNEMYTESGGESLNLEVPETPLIGGNDKQNAKPQNDNGTPDKKIDIDEQKQDNEEGADENLPDIEQSGDQNSDYPQNPSVKNNKITDSPQEEHNIQDEKINLPLSNENKISASHKNEETYVKKNEGEGNVGDAQGHDTQASGDISHEFVEAEDSHFFLYFSSMIVMCTIIYILFHNKNKILALALEGRRKPRSHKYQKLGNLETAIASSCDKPGARDIIY